MRLLRDLLCGFNLYWYVRNNPANKVDPSGLDAYSDCINQCNQVENYALLKARADLQQETKEITDSIRQLSRGVRNKYTGMELAGLEMDQLADAYEANEDISKAKAQGDKCRANCQMCPLPDTPDISSSPDQTQYA